MADDPHIRPETPADHAVVRSLIAAAFRGAEHSDQSEAEIVERLREASAMALSLVAVDKDGGILGHIAISPVTLESGESGWYGLGPLAVWPQLQRRGIGTALVTDGLRRLKERGAKGCVVLVDPAFYARFGFKSDPALTYRGVPSRYVQRLVVTPPAPSGEITYHPAFEAAA